MARLEFSFLIAVVYLTVFASAANNYTNEPNQWRQKPAKIRGSYQVLPLNNGACNTTCLATARLVLDRFTQFTYFKYYQFLTPNYTTNPYERAGIRTCEEVEESLNCYNECNDRQRLNGGELDEPLELLSLRRVGLKYCEKQYTPGYKPCRLADTRGCDMQFSKASCKDKLAGWLNCVDEVLEKSGQDCDGLCTPARRFKAVNKFMWIMECSLKEAWDSRCGILVSFRCFGGVKDTDTNFGLYEEFHLNETIVNDLDPLCREFDAPLPCMDEVTTEYVDYYGFNVSKPCHSVADKIERVKEMWQNLTNPFCTRDTDQKTFVDVCPDPDPVELPPSTTHWAPVFTTATPAPIKRDGGGAQEAIATWKDKDGLCPSWPKPENMECQTCYQDGQCRGAMKCCDNCCRGAVRAKTRLGGTKSGKRRCRAPLRSLSTCIRNQYVHKCTEDTDCFAHKMCCRVGCRKRCIRPLYEPTTATLSPA